MPILKNIIFVSWDDEIPYISLSAWLNMKVSRDYYSQYIYIYIYTHIYGKIKVMFETTNQWLTTINGRYISRYNVNSGLINPKRLFNWEGTI